MGAFPAFVLGVVVGWIIEWIIDWIYWRRRTGSTQVESSQLRDQLAKAEARNKDLERQLAMQAPVTTSMQDRLASVETGGETAAAQVEAVPPVPDDLIQINGIGPVIASKLNQAGITTFEQLAQLTPAQLRELVGDSISRLADEEDLIAQAKEFAAQKRGRG